jgi:hypothetical protein
LQAGYRERKFVAPALAMGLRIGGAESSRTGSAAQLCALRRPAVFGLPIPAGPEPLAARDGWVIGRQRRFLACDRSLAATRDVFAFGHGHIGSCLGLTGRLIADLIAGRVPLLDLSRSDRAPQADCHQQRGATKRFSRMINSSASMPPAS